MERSLIFAALTLALPVFGQTDTQNGESVYNRFCASCHGSDGTGLIGPNLTDEQILHGDSYEDIRRVVELGVQGKSMPAWGSILSEQEISDVSAFVKTMVGTNLQGPNQRAVSTVTPFPQGSLDRPYLIRTFMPTLGLPDAVFKHHGDGEPIHRYNPNTGTSSDERVDPTIPGIPGAIAVNFGETLSYCFDSTECRLLYTWDGKFLDMTNYWGAGEGGGRKSFGYLAEVAGEPDFKASGAPLFQGTPQFLGYRKVNSVPEFEYKVGDLKVTLRIEPGNRQGEAICHYTTNASGSLIVTLPKSEGVKVAISEGKEKNGAIRLTKKEARAFAITLTPLQ